jgi:hypothetical protein
MPYGISKNLGGDSQSTDARMEKCVADLTGKGYKKLNAILICKSTIQKSLAKGRRT